MRILILAQFFTPEPDFKGLPFARELRARGHEVEVLTGFPNYPGGKLYTGYRLRRRQVEFIDGFRVNRVWLYPSHDSSPLRRVANYMSFALSAAVQGAQLASRPDVIWAYHPPATIGIAARRLAAHWRVPVVLDVQDLWPDTVASSGMLSMPPALALLDRLCRALYRSAAHVTVLSDGFRRTLIERGVSPERVSVIYNWCDEASMRRAPGAGERHRAEMGWDGRLVVMFAGTMGRAQGLDAVLEAAARCATAVPEALFAFVGGGVERDRLAGAARERGLANVTFVERQPPAAMAEWLAAADVVLVHLRDDPLFRITIPSKTQAYMAAGRPILMGVAGDACRLLEAAGAGVCCTPEDPAALAAAVARLAAMPRAERERLGASGRAYYDAHLSLTAGVSAYEAVFTRVVRLAAGDQVSLRQDGSR